MLLIELLAEREGFEPPVPLSTVVFKTTVIDHSTISPSIVLCFGVPCVKRRRLELPRAEPTTPSK